MRRTIIIFLFFTGLLAKKYLIEVADKGEGSGEDKRGDEGDPNLPGYSSEPPSSTPRLQRMPGSWSPLRPLLKRRSDLARVTDGQVPPLFLPPPLLLLRVRLVPPHTGFISSGGLPLYWYFHATASLPVPRLELVHPVPQTVVSRLMTN